MTATRMSAEERRHHLCQVARGLFLVHGYRGTTTAAVAEGAGVSDALLIKHFGTKAALFREAIAEPVVGLLEQALAANQEHARQGPGPLVDQVARLHDFGVAWAELIREHGPLMLALFREANEFPDVVGQVRQMVTDMTGAVASSLATLTGGPDYRDFDIRVATFAGLAAMAAAPLAGDDLKSYMDELIPILMLGLLSPGGRCRLLERHEVAAP